MYSDTLLDHFGNPRNVGKVEPCNATGVAGNPDAGPFVALYLRIEGDVIRQAGFQTYGCAAAIAAGSLLTVLIQGKTLAEAASVDAAMLRAALGGLPLGKEHCADIAISALAAALRRD